MIEAAPRSDIAPMSASWGWNSRFLFELYNFEFLFQYEISMVPKGFSVPLNEGFSPPQPQPIEPQPNKNIENISLTVYQFRKYFFLF